MKEVQEVELSGVKSTCQRSRDDRLGMRGHRHRLKPTRHVCTRYKFCQRRR